MVMGALLDKSDFEMSFLVAYGFVFTQLGILPAIQVPFFCTAKAGAWGSDPHAPATSRNRFWTGMFERVSLPGVLSNQLRDLYA
jgi:hypothetical protein